jgi:hypothetical protein
MTPARRNGNMGATGQPSTEPGAPVPDDAATEVKPPAEYLRAESRNPRGSSLEADNHREWWCDDCGRRVTRSARKPVEYGHAADCRHGIDRSPAMYGGGDS